MPIYLKEINSEDTINGEKYPLNLPAYKNWINITITSSIVIFCWENGSWKSTLLESIASACGFNSRGWNRNHVYGGSETNELTNQLRFSWLPKISTGFYMKADSFSYFSDYLDSLSENDPSILNSYWWKSLSKMSHWERFISLFSNKFKKWIYILDEPESALSPKKQLEFIALISHLSTDKWAQFIISTHSPFIMSIPHAQLYQIDEMWINTIPFKETNHYELSKLFFDNPSAFHRNLY